MQKLFPLFLFFNCFFYGPIKNKSNNELISCDCKVNATMLGSYCIYMFVYIYILSIKYNIHSNLYVCIYLCDFLIT